MLIEEEDYRLSKFFDALSNAVRLKLVLLLIGIIRCTITHGRRKSRKTVRQSPVFTTTTWSSPRLRGDETSIPLNARNSSKNFWSCIRCFVGRKFLPILYNQFFPRSDSSEQSFF